MKEDLSDVELQRNQIIRLQNGEFKCDLCWKYPSDMQRVREHLDGGVHKRRMLTAKYNQAPLTYIPEEHRRWAEVVGWMVKCTLCNRGMVETHWNSYRHVRNVEWKLWEQQQAQSSSSSSQSYVASAMVESPPPMPPTPPSPGHRSSGSGQSSGTVSEKCGQQHVISVSNHDQANWLDSPGVTGTGTAPTTCKTTPFLDDEGCVIYHV